MHKGYLLVDVMGGAAGAPFQTYEDAAKHINPMFDEVMEIELDTSPRDDETVLLEEQLWEVFQRRDIANVHFSWGWKFWTLSYNERLKTVIQYLDQDFDKLESVNLNEDSLRDNIIDLD
jgi:hypothetical protein